MIPDPLHPGHTIDPATGIWPIAEWGSACGRGFVSDERFSRGSDQVIKRTNRNMSRKWRAVAGDLVPKPKEPVPTALELTGE